MSMRVADYIVKFIYDNGVKDVFMLSGGGIMHLTDGLACNKNLNIICLHHEQAVSMALEAYGRFTGNLGVGFFTSGPGATNAITGLAGAWQDSSPCLFISGQVKRKDSIFKSRVPEIRQIGVQEVNIVPVVESLSKYSAFVDNPEDIKYHLEKAIYLAKKGRPGPVWLDIPLDVQASTIDQDSLKGFEIPEKNNISEETLQKVIQYIKSASRPVILAGQGVRIAGAINSLLKFAEEYKIPIITTYLGIDIIENDHPQYVGRIGIKGDRAGNLAIQNSDLLITIGTSLPVSEISYECDKFAREANIIVVDIDETSHKKKSIKIDLFVEVDAKEFIEKVYDMLKEENNVSFDNNWLETCISWKENYPVCLPEYKELKDKINIYYLVDQLSKKLSSGDVVVTDAGSTFYVGSQAIKIKKGVRYITSGGLATMGYSLPASIGLSVALGKKKVMCLTGDGSFQQNIQELQSVIHHNLPLKIFVLNNNGYLSIRFTQSRYFDKRFIGEGPKSGVSLPSTERIANAYRIKFIRANNNDELNKVLDEVIEYDGPVLCEVMCPPEQLIIPTIASEKKEDGTMISKPLEDMYPFLDREEFKENMIIKPLDE
jgi:acetolactate synthase I/II/III large subunit